jgi:hypothetical protein
MSIRLSATFVSYRNERCYSPEVSKVLKALILGIFILGLESCHLPSYAYGVHPHGELALVGYQSLAHIPRINAVFLCVLSTRSRFMAKLEGDAFARAGDLESQSTNPFQLCHHNYLVVIGRASIDSLGAH